MLCEAIWEWIELRDDALDEGVERRSSNSCDVRDQLPLQPLAAGAPDFLSRSQPVVPTMTEAFPHCCTSFALLKDLERGPEVWKVSKATCIFVSKEIQRYPNIVVWHSRNAFGAGSAAMVIDLASFTFQRHELKARAVLSFHKYFMININITVILTVPVAQPSS